MKVTGVAAENGFQSYRANPQRKAGRAVPRVWYVLANKGNAHVFRKNGNHLERVADFAPDEENTIGRAQKTDGHAAGTGQGHAFYTSDPMDRERNHDASVFLTHVAEWLDDARRAQAFDSIVLAASAEALGLIRPVLSKEVAELVVSEIDKDLTKSPILELEDTLIGPNKVWH